MTPSEGTTPAPIPDSSASSATSQLRLPDHVKQSLLNRMTNCNGQQSAKAVRKPVRKPFRKPIRKRQEITILTILTVSLININAWVQELSDSIS
jgi:hypothetical protein